MTRGPRHLSDAERAFWANYADRLMPLRDRIATSPAPAAAPPVSAAEPRPTPPRPTLREPMPPPVARPPSVARPLAIGDPPGGVDRATWQRFRAGRLAAERKLDLHGHTAQRAFHALVGFVRSAHAEGVRCVEVVTGRGSGGEIGVIRREFPLWLNRPDIRPLVLAAAHPHAANPGAVRLLLRRMR